jgi:dienelactone hydrolase
MIRFTDPDSSVPNPAPPRGLRGSLMLPHHPRGLVILSYPMARGDLDPMIRQVARGLVCQGYATLLLDLLLPRERQIDLQTRRFDADIDLLAKKFSEAADWAQRHTVLAGLEIGFFVTDTAIDAAIRVAVERAREVTAIVALGGQPALAGPELERLTAAVLMIAGQNEPATISNQAWRLTHPCNPAERRLTTVPGRVDAPVGVGLSECIAELTTNWFQGHLGLKAHARFDSQFPLTPALQSLQ